MFHHLVKVVAPDSKQPHRHILHFGRDDVTTFYTDLLRRVSFPYHEVDLNRRLDWQMMDELTTRTCTLLDVSRELSAQRSCSG